MKTQTCASSQERKHLYISIGSFVVSLILFLAAAFPQQANAMFSARQQQDVRFPAIQGDGPLFLYAAGDRPELTISQIQKISEHGKAQWKLNTLRKLQLFAGSEAQISHVAVSPDGNLVALEVYDEIYPSTWILDLRSGRLSPALERGYSQLLGWHPDGNQLIVKVLDTLVSDPGLWFVDIHSGKHKRIDIPNLPPEGLLGAAISPDGNSLAYAFSKGMGFGSELWIMDLTNNIAKQIRYEEHGMIGYILWTPNGRQIVFTAMADSPVPYDEAGLFVVNADGSNLELLSSMDGGHGQEPHFGNDGQTLYFVERNNQQDKKANYDASALVSSIHTVNLTTHQTEELVSADGADQLDISLSADGDVFFVSNRGGSPDIWAFDISGNLQQVTADGKNKRYPLFVSSH
jgi:Tol biopolymer transport system component